MSGHKSRKKGSNIICRVANVTPEMVCSYVKRMPKHKMKEETFRDIMGKNWFQNEHQAPEQWGLYYIDGTDYYPRFDHDITKEEAEAYLYHWMRNLVVINPYTRFKKQCDENLVDSIVRQLEKDPSEHDLKTIISRIINSDEPFVINEIIANALNHYSRVLKVETINKDNEQFNVSLIPNYKEILNTHYNMTKKEYFELFDSVKTAFDPDAPIQQIFYGAPGTGKSHIVKIHTEGESVVRTTFHPDSDYSTFVGCYKPTTKEIEMRDVTGKIIIERDQPVTENRIIYQFVDQAFLQAYIKAWKFYAEAEEGVAPNKQFLIIEEINRGNCAQIFGDLFQLLDRNDSGFSEYFIHADKDMQKHLSNAFKDCLIKDSHKDAINSLYPKEDDVVAKVLSGEILLLPNNLYIWATMNTSDQSLFPIDSAFKRRWDWEYEPIKYKNIDWVIDIEGSKYLWTSFQREINKRIFDATNSEDKMLGDYFVNPADGVITEKILLNKILFYLWNDVCKDGEGDIFKTADNEDVTFSDLHSDGGTDKLIAMMKYLKVKEA